MATNVVSASTEPHYFYEDVVYRVDKRGNVEFGIVMENDDQEMSDESSESEELLSKEKKGEIRVVWHPSGFEESVNSKKIHLADRTLMPGDVVRRMIKGKDTQRGYCRDIELTACVQVAGTKQILADIKSEDLIPLEEFSSDIAVCMNSWVGGIRMVHFKLWLSTPDGSRCVINEMDARALEHFEEKRDNDNNFPHSSKFYPGQSLWGPVHCLEDAEWISCTKEMMAKRKTRPQKITKVTVRKVETDWVGVHWQYRAYSKDGALPDQAQPKFVVDGEDLKNLKLLNVFEPSTLQVGDRDLYVYKGTENIITREQWRKRQRQVFKVPKQSPRKSRANAKISEEWKNNRINGINVSEQSGYVSDGTLMPPPPNYRNESSDEWDTEDTASQSDTASESSDATENRKIELRHVVDEEGFPLISSGCSSTSSMGKKKKGPALMTKVLKKKKLWKAKKKVAPSPLVSGTKIVVESISTSTKANVVWQDGSVELGIPSTQLHPIHHLDDKEFFPGDFVVDQKEECRMYGVVQSVDHQGRTANIKWFKTYTSTQSPGPTLLDEREVSVYDLKDHPDFQYRPGTLVIRIANFEGEDSGCTAGQVLDNYPEGRVKIWWVDGHVSMCWPQDLYKVGVYDSEDVELWDDASSDASWETELEDSFLTDNDGIEPTGNIKPKLAAHIEKARIALSRLEEIFTQNPALQTTEVMRKLLEVYKDCRCMDKLMGTSFFHESHFQGLLERVRERGRANVAQRMADQVTRLFTHQSTGSEQSIDGEPENANTIGNSSETLEKITTKITGTVDAANNVKVEEKSTKTGEKKIQPLEKQREEVFIDVKTNPGDSGHYSNENSKKESGSSESSGEFPLSEDANNPIYRSPPPPEAMDDDSREPQRSQDSFTNSHVASARVCVKLCTLIKAQLVLAHGEVSKRFGLSKMHLSDAAKNASPQKTSKKEEDEEVEEEEKGVEDTAKKEETAKVSIEADVEVPPPIYPEGEGFSIEDSAPDSHKFKLTMFQPTDPTTFFRTVSRELKLLRSCLPPGIWVKGFEDRIDLYSVMFRGPEKTPYEDGLFLFDFQLSADYPIAPPLCHYISYCSDRLNPNLYEEGKVCVSLLGTWAGKGTEVWTMLSTLLQVIVSIQGLILVPEPYFNEAGFEKQKGSQQGRENSRMYNEMVVLKLVQAQTKLLQYPPSVFKDVIIRHFQRHAEKLLKRLDMWMEISERHNNQHPLSPVTPTTFKEFPEIDETILPEFPLIPASKGFCITLRKTLATFKSVLVKEGMLKLPTFDFELCDIDKAESTGESSKTSSHDYNQTETTTVKSSTSNGQVQINTENPTNLESSLTCDTKKDCAERNSS